jgi:Rad3-related DNA helicase
MNALFPYPEIRDQQQTAMDFINDTFKNKDKKFCIIEAGTGVGKSALGIYTANLLQNSVSDKEDGCYFLTTQKILQNQYMEDFSSIENMLSLKSSSNYNCSYYKGTSCGESLRILKTASKDSAFWRCCAINCHYKKEKERFINGKKGVTNFSYFLAETVYAGKLKPKNFLVIDEAHNAADELSKFTEVTISERFCKSQNINFPRQLTALQAFKWIQEKYYPHVRNRLKHMEGMMDKYVGLKEKIKEIQKVSTNFDLLDKHVCKVKRFMDRYEKDNWVFNLIPGEGRSMRKLEFKPIDVSKYAHEYLFDRSNKILLMSATILDKNAFCQMLGIPKDDCEFLSLASPFPIDNKPIITAGIGKMSAKHIDITLPKLVSAIESIISAHGEEKGIIHCHSYKIANFIKNNIKIGKNRLIFHTSEDRDEALEKHKGIDKPTILLSPSMTEGVDLRDDLSRFQVICKIPYPYLGDKLIRKKMNKWKWWYPLQTAKTIIQSIGRSVRSKEDYATTYILDEDWDRFYSMNRNLFPKDFHESIKND